MAHTDLILPHYCRSPHCYLTIDSVPPPAFLSMLLHGLHQVQCLVTDSSRGLWRACANSCCQLCCLATPQHDVTCWSKLRQITLGVAHLRSGLWCMDVQDVSQAVGAACREQRWISWIDWQLYSGMCDRKRMHIHFKKSRLIRHVHPTIINTNIKFLFMFQYSSYCLMLVHRESTLQLFVDCVH